jgi:malonyl-ACP decarboxylase
MKNLDKQELVISGIGVTSAVGQGQKQFTEALMNGSHQFGFMKRPGRQKGNAFVGAEIPALNIPQGLSNRLMRSASFSGQAALVTLHEAWSDAGLDQVEPGRIGLVIGGSNFQQRELIQTYQNYADRAEFVRPTYGLSFMDSDLCGLCTEQFGIGGLSYTVGGASASGQLAVIQAAQAVLAGQVDVCIAMGALMDISYWECHSLRALGAMGTDKYADEPSLACRPFDKDRDGFIYGESCGAVVIERSGFAALRKVKPYAALSGWALKMDGNRNPNPSYEGEVYVVQKTLEQAGISNADINYINPHGTGSMIGDETELRALRDCGLMHARINATKSILGHGLSAAGTVEVIATVLQMKEARLHPTRNLENPIEPDFLWVGACAEPYEVKHSLTLSMGFGGINTALCLTKL